MGTKEHYDPATHNLKTAYGDSLEQQYLKTQLI